MTINIDPHEVCSICGKRGWTHKVTSWDDNGKKLIEYRCPVCNARRGVNPGQNGGLEEKLAYQKYLQENEYIDSRGYVCHYWKG